ncbi:head maturation protease, ClpP-related [Paenibacillus pseudetheri]|uniref:ATP-dependent Clp protease proteolytic subunit n=1 Tax=Paenibacillus pseudetheri TaxID=2897682 RepID=A0ABN8FS62_9BACL|nr:head maturation protease, ClpP-related [Paenibacillus pseudetheri]CAH1058860.1 ATP-dependent Clp protease proteolytic subunit [Paenibacillus pseudetheri]
MAIRINLYGTIVASEDSWIYEYFEMDHTTPRHINEQLAQANGDDVEIYVNSPGGDMWAGSEIYSSLREYAGNTIAKVISLAASAASVAICGAKRVLISPTAQIMVHRSSTGAWGNKNDLDQASQMVKSVDEGMVNAYEYKTGKTRDELFAWMDAETFMNAQQAVENGFADEVMFGQMEKVVAVATAAPLFSNEVLSKVKSKLLKENMFPSATVTPLTSGMNENPAGVTAKNDNEEEAKIMDIAELKEKHPDLFAQVTGDAQTAERTRVAAITSLAEKTPGSAELVKAAIANGETAGELAIKMIEASQTRIVNAGKDRALDAEESGVDTVASLEAKPTGAAKEEDAEAAVTSMIAMAQNMRPKNGGRR